MRNSIKSTEPKTQDEYNAFFAARPTKLSSKGNALNQTITFYQGKKGPVMVTIEGRLFETPFKDVRYIGRFYEPIFQNGKMHEAR